MISHLSVQSNVCTYFSISYILPLFHIISLSFLLDMQSTLCFCELPQCGSLGTVRSVALESRLPFSWQELNKCCEIDRTMLVKYVSKPHATGSDCTPSYLNHVGELYVKGMVKLRRQK